MFKHLQKSFTGNEITKYKVTILHIKAYIYIFFT